MSTLLRAHDGSLEERLDDLVAGLAHAGRFSLLARLLGRAIVHVPEEGVTVALGALSHDKLGKVVATLPQVAAAVALAGWLRAAPYRGWLSERMQLEAERQWDAARADHDERAERRIRELDRRSRERHGDCLHTDARGNYDCMQPIGHVGPHGAVCGEVRVTGPGIGGSHAITCQRERGHAGDHAAGVEGWSG